MITNEECVFADGESTKTIKIGIIDDDQPEEVSVGAGTNYLVEPRSRGGAGLCSASLWLLSPHSYSLETSPPHLSRLLLFSVYRMSTSSAS